VGDDTPLNAKQREVHREAVVGAGAAIPNFSNSSVRSVLLAARGVMEASELRVVHSRR
jgi:hypothetical protein